MLAALYSGTPSTTLMIIGIVATPNLCLLDMMYSGETYGYSFMHYSNRYSKRYRVIKPSRVLCHTDVRPVFFDSIASFNHAYQRLNLTEASYLVLLGGNPIDHVEYGFEVWTGSVLAPYDLIKLNNGKQKPTKKVTDLIGAITKSVGGVGILQNVYPLFYRVKDKAARTSLQRAVYSYLRGDRKRIPSTTIQKLAQVLRSSHVVALRSAAIAAQSEGVDKAAKRFGVDHFELSYVLSKT